ncbi:MAG TPA: hypothetical protein VLK78_09835 [Candidatus Angelobacter sp.]|nr:hypothetical protein [Candidatus Angelobacter sp.]
MARKMLTLFSIVAFAFFYTFSVSHAETVTSGKMFDSFNKKYKQENYDYKNGSFQLEDVQTFNLDQPITVKNGNDQVQVTKVQAGIAHFQTSRDGIFKKDWIDYAYYAPEANLILTEGDVMNVKQIKTYEKQHTTSVKLELGPIVGFMLLLVIIPLLLAYFWTKFGYSTLEFRLKNNLLDPDPKRH